MKRTAIRRIGILLILLLVISALPIFSFAAEPVTSVQENFEGVTEFSDLGWTAIENAPVIHEESGNTMLKLSAPSGSYIRSGINIPFGNTEKTVRFDFKYDGTLTSIWGLYMFLYRENAAPETRDGLGGGIMPGLSDFQMSTNLYLPAETQERANYTFSSNTWYTCVMELSETTMKMKVYPAGGTDSGWQIEHAFSYTTSDVNNDVAIMMVTTPDAANFYLDNLSVSAPQEDDTPQENDALRENFETVAAFSDLGWSAIENSPVIYEESGNTMLKLSAPSGSYIRSGINIPFDQTEKQLKFDFKYDGTLTSIWGLYMFLYREDAAPETRDGLGGGIMPGLSDFQMSTNLYLPAETQERANYTFSANTWYTCVMELSETTMKMKVYPVGGTDSGWQIEHSFSYTTSDVNNDVAIMMVTTPDAANFYLDNLSIAPLQSSQPEVSLTDPEYTYFTDDFDGYTVGTADKANMKIHYLNVPAATVADLGGNKILALKPSSDSGSLKIFVPAENKELYFDFAYEQNFNTYGGLYTGLHQEADGSNYHFGLLPNHDAHVIMADDGDHLLANGGPTFTTNTWYHCRSRMQDKTLYLKVWQGDAEPADWQYSASFESRGFTANPQDYISFRAVDPQVDTNWIYLDNLVIKTWEDLAVSGCEVTVNSASETQGTVTGGGTYPTGAQVTVKAIPAAGYGFVNWTDANDEEVSTDASYTFVAAEGISLTANFVKLVPTIKSFMAAGMTLPAQIDVSAKTVTVTFASDTDLTQVRPYFYLENGSGTEPKPYQVMDLSSGSVQIGEWTVYAEKNSVMTQFYVDPVTGDDANDGTSRTKAVKTLERAQELVRGIGSWTGDVIVNLAAGEYLLTETLEFTSSDSAENGCAVIWQGNGDVTISSGRHLTGWTESAAVEGAWEFDATGIPYSRDLYVEGARATLARSSAGKSIIPTGWNMADQPDMQFVPAYGYLTSGDRAELYKWRNQSDIEFVYEVGWSYSVIPVTSIMQEGSGSKVTMMDQPFQDAQKKGGVQIHDPNYIQNAFELLDEAGEWYFDRTAEKIYYIPAAGTNPNDLEIVLPTLDQLVTVRGTGSDPVEGLAFRNLDFVYSSYLRPHTMGQVEIQANFVVRQDLVQECWRDCFLKTPGAVTAAYAHGMRVEGCSFTKMSASGFDFEEGCVGCTLTESTFSQISASGIQVGGVSARDAQPFSNVTYVNGVLTMDAGPDPTRVTEQILVMSNLLDTIGVEYKGSIGIFAGCVRDVTIAHNQLNNLPYSGISAGWNWGTWDQGGRPDHAFYKFDTPTIQERYVIENNEIIKVMQRLHDGAPIYTLSLMPGSIIRGNYMHDTAYPISGIYNDEASGGFVDISENVVANSDGSYYNYHNAGGYYPDRYEATMAVMHDNYWNSGSMEDPLYAEIVSRAGLLPWKDYGTSVDEDAAAAVEAMIAALPAEVTLENEDAIEAVRAAYDALTDAQKDLVTNDEVLTAAEAKLAELRQAAAAAAALAKAKSEAKAAIEAYKDAADYREAERAELAAAIEAANTAIEEAESTEAVAAAVESAKTAMDAIKTDAQLKQEEAAADAAAAAGVEELIEKIGTVTLNSKADIEAARAAYDKLTPAQKALVENLSDLEAAESKLAELQQDAADTAAAAEVDDEIEAIGTVTLNSKAAIEAARAAYDALTPAQKAKVTKLAKLEAAEAKYDELVEKAEQDEIDEAAAKGVEDLIEAIGAVTLGDKKAIEAARAAYDALTDAQKALVDNYDELTAAEAELKELIEDAFLTGSLILSGASNPFKDIKNHWAKDAIGYVYAKGLMNGVEDDKFDPDATLTRAMVVTILYRLSGEPVTFGTAPFSDVESGSWYAKAVLWASKNNIVNGMGDGTFAPMQNITREQFASILYRYAQYRGERTGAKANLNGYQDAGQISGWATEAMAWAAAEGLINGRTAATIAPKGTATRAEAATILMRFCKNF